MATLTREHGQWKAASSHWHGTGFHDPFADPDDLRGLDGQSIVISSGSHGDDAVPGRLAGVWHGTAVPAVRQISLIQDGHEDPPATELTLRRLDRLHREPSTLHRHSPRPGRRPPRQHPARRAPAQVVGIRSTAPRIYHWQEPSPSDSRGQPGRRALPLHLLAGTCASQGHSANWRPGTYVHCCKSGASPSAAVTKMQLRCIHSVSTPGVLSVT